MNITTSNEDRFHENVLAGIPVDRARDFAAQDTTPRRPHRLLGATDGDRAIWHYSDDHPVLVRDIAMDQGETWAWRFEQPCTTECHHPVHALGHPERLRHVEWFSPGTTALIPAAEDTGGQEGR